MTSCQKLLSGEQRAVCSCLACILQTPDNSIVIVLYGKTLKWKTRSFLFFTCLLLPLQFYLSYKLCTVCPLEIVWFLSFMLSECVFFLHCFRSLCIVRDSECYLWWFDLLPYSLKSSQSIYVFCFAQNHIFPISQSNLVLKVSPFWKRATSRIVFSTFSKRENQFSQTDLSYRILIFSLFQITLEDCAILVSRFISSSSKMCRTAIDPLNFCITDGRLLRWERLLQLVKKCGI